MTTYHESPDTRTLNLPELRQLNERKRRNRVIGFVAGSSLLAVVGGGVGFAYNSIKNTGVEAKAATATSDTLDTEPAVSFEGVAFKADGSVDLINTDRSALLTNPEAMALVSESEKASMFAVPKEAAEDPVAYTKAVSEATNGIITEPLTDANYKTWKDSGFKDAVLNDITKKYPLEPRLKALYGANYKDLGIITVEPLRLNTVQLWGYNKSQGYDFRPKYTLSVNGDPVIGPDGTINELPVAATLTNNNQLPGMGEPWDIQSNTTMYNIHVNEDGLVLPESQDSVELVRSNLVK